MLFAFSFFFFNDTATTEIYTLSLHDALPISRGRERRARRRRRGARRGRRRSRGDAAARPPLARRPAADPLGARLRVLLAPRPSRPRPSRGPTGHGVVDPVGRRGDAAAGARRVARPAAPRLGPGGRRPGALPRPRRHGAPPPRAELGRPAGRGAAR